MAKTDVATVPEGRGMAKIEPTPQLVQQVWDAILNDEIPPEVGDPAITARAIAERIRQGSFDEAMTPAESVPSWSEEDGPVMVLGFHLNKSTFENAQTGKKGVYAIVELVGQNGAIFTRSSGAQNVLCQLAKAWEEGRFPFECELQAELTASGNSTFWLRPVGFVKGR